MRMAKPEGKEKFVKNAGFRIPFCLFMVGYRERRRKRGWGKYAFLPPESANDLYFLVQNIYTGTSLLRAGCRDCLRSLPRRLQEVFPCVAIFRGHWIMRAAFMP